MRAIFVRHGQSTGNAGVPCDDLAAIELTELGWSQAGQVAEDWQQRPALIVTSPYLRTQQTAAPTIERFPDVPVEVWPIEEFTYLQPSRWNGTRSAERMPHLERYWSEADPSYCDGEGAESFATLLARARSALGRLAALPSSSPAYVFSHGQFIQAVRAIVTEPELDDRGKMLRFWRKGEPPAIGNGELILFEWQDGRWHHRPGGRANLDRVMESINADLPWHHKQLWTEKATKLRDAVRRSEGAEQERARQALQDHYRTQAHPETSRDEIMRRLRRRH
jgi:broad specificity phosphatase PhoE